MTRVKRVKNNEQIESIKKLIDQLNGDKNTSYVIMGVGPKRHLFSSLIGDQDEIAHMVNASFKATPGMQAAMKANIMQALLGGDDDD